VFMYLDEEDSQVFWQPSQLVEYETYFELESDTYLKCAQEIVADTTKDFPDWSDAVDVLGLRVQGYESTEVYSATTKAATSSAIKWNVGGGNTSEQKHSLHSLLTNNIEVFAFDVGDLRIIHNHQMEITLEHDNAIYTPPHRLSAHEWEMYKESVKS